MNLFKKTDIDPDPEMDSNEDNGLNQLSAR